MRKSTLFFAFILLSAASCSLLLVHPRMIQSDYQKALATRHQQVREFGLTDLCLFTEARYTRHLSQADLHAAFQDHPLSLDHFPSGSLLAPPVALWRSAARAGEESGQ